jgi:hypothetical protein
LARREIHAKCVNPGSKKARREPGLIDIMDNLRR